MQLFYLCKLKCFSYNVSLSFLSNDTYFLRLGDGAAGFHVRPGGPALLKGVPG